MFIDLYTVDPAALAKTDYWPAPFVHPSRYLGSFMDNGPGDLDATAGTFAFDLSSYGLTDGTYVTVLVTHSQDALVSNAGTAVTGPAAWPVSRRPELKIRILGQTTQLSWLGAENAFTVQNNGSLNPPDWAYILGGTTTYTTGRNIMELQFDTFANVLVYRLISQ